MNPYTLFRVCMLAALIGQSGIAAATEVEGRLAWLQRVELASVVSGTVLEVLVAPGEKVAKGQVLTRLDQRKFRTAMAEARAVQARERVALAEAERELERAKELYDRQVLSDHELKLAEIGAVMARSAAALADAAIAKAQLALEQSALSAPFNALVVEVSAAPGQVVLSELESTVLVVLARDAALVAEVPVTAAQADASPSGSERGLRAGGHAMSGQVVDAGLEPLAGVQGKYLLRVRLPAADHAGLRVGQPVVVELPD